MKYQVVALVVLGFLAGILTVQAAQDLQLPRSPLSPERASPQDWVSESKIHITDDYVRIDVPGAVWAKFADSNSMDPLIDTGANGIQIIPTSPDQLKIGDVVTYDLDGKKIIHRIVDIGQDSKGYYFILKGDNNPEPDPEPVRFEDIERVLIAVVY